MEPAQAGYLCESGQTNGYLYGPRQACGCLCGLSRSVVT